MVRWDGTCLSSQHLGGPEGKRLNNSRPYLVTYGTTEQYELQSDTASKQQMITYIHVDTEKKRECFFFHLILTSKIFEVTWLQTIIISTLRLKPDPI